MQHHDSFPCTNQCFGPDLVETAKEEEEEEEEEEFT